MRLLPLRLRLPLTMLVFGLAVIAVDAWMSWRQEMRQHEATLRARLMAQGTRLAGLAQYLLAKGDLDGANMDIGLLATVPNLDVAMLCDATNRVMLSTQARWRGQPLAESPLGAALPLVESVRREHRSQVITQLGGHALIGAFHFSLPARAGEVRPAGFGVAVLQFDLVEVFRSARRDAVREAALLAGVVIAGCLIVWLVLHWSLTARLLKLVSTTREIGHGNYAAKSALTPGDELGELSTALDHMGDQLRQHSETLRESEQRFRQMADHSPMMVWVMEPDGRASFLSKSWYDFTGQTPETGLGMGWEQAVHPEDRDATTRIYVAARAKREPFRQEYRLRRKDGAYRWVIDVGSPRFGANGEFLGYVGSVLDITERRESEERLRAVLDTAVEGIITIDERGRIESINPAALNIFGYTTEEVMGQNVKILMPAPYAEAHDGYLANYLRTGERKIIGIGREVLGLRKDGTVFPMDLSVTAIQVGGQRKFTGFVRDITRRKEAEAALRESEQRMRAVLDTAVEGIITIDERGRLESINPAALDIFGYTTEEVMGQNIKMLMPMPYAEAHDGYLANYLRTGERKIIGIGREVLGLRKDGTVFPMDLSVTEIQVGGQRKFTGFVRDITRRKEAERQLQQAAQELAAKNKELETVVYVISHDLRSPLVNVQGFSKRLGRASEELSAAVQELPAQTPVRQQASKALTEIIPQSLQFIHAGVAKMDALLAGFLKYSRLGRVTLTVRALDMNALLTETVAAMRFQIEQAQAEVSIGLLPPCRGDATQIGQVFANLLDNALKYRDPARPLRVTVSGRVEGNQVIYAVADNGLGIAPEHQAKVFEIFHRLNPSATPGEGLGLTIAQRVLERQDGRIWVESQAGAGSTFFVSLPSMAVGA